MADTIAHTTIVTPLGPFTVAGNSAGICYASFGEFNEADVRASGPKHTLVRRLSECRQGKEEEELPAERYLLNATKAIRRYFEGDISALDDLKVLPHGTDFQKQVWRGLRRIKPGKTKSYSELAQNIDNPKAVRAVGMACKHNPIALFIPCHRVIGKNRSLTGFAGGLERKAALLNHEGLGLE